MEQKIGKTIGNYITEKVLGKGQFGVVYLAKSLKDGKDYAIKCINKSVAD